MIQKCDIYIFLTNNNQSIYLLEPELEVEGVSWKYVKKMLNLYDQHFQKNQQLSNFISRHVSYIFTILLLYLLILL